MVAGDSMARHGIRHGIHIRMRAEPTTYGGIVADGELTFEKFGLAHRALSHDPIDGVSASMRGTVRIDLLRRRIETETLQISLNGLTSAVAGWVERSQDDRVAMDVSVRVPTVSCDAIRRALPHSLTGPVDDLQFAGTIATDAHIALDTRQLNATELEIAVDDHCVLVRDGLERGIRRFAGPFVQRVQEPHGLRAFVTGPGTAAWTPIAQISSFLTNAVLSREDGRFYAHHGIDVGEIRSAIVRNVGARRFVYGASTISMQLAKNVFLAREKTLVRKLQEFVLTWYLEHTLNKQTILELYLNVVEFGPGIYGIGPAARFFFGREPRDLTPLQAIYLATLLPNPSARFWNFQRGAVVPDTLARLRSYARHMAQVGLLSDAEAEFAQSEELGVQASERQHSRLAHPDGGFSNDGRCRPHDFTTT